MALLRLVREEQLDESLDLESPESTDPTPHKPGKLGNCISLLALPDTRRRGPRRTKGPGVGAAKAPSPPVSRPADSPPTKRHPGPSPSPISLLALPYTSSPDTSLDLALSLPSEIRSNREAYVGKEWMTITALPSLVLLALNSIQERVRPRPSLSLLMTCAIHHGIASIQANSSVSDLLSLRRDLLALDRDVIDADDLEEQFAFYRSWKLGTPLSESECRQQSLQVTEWVKGELHELAGELGVSGIGGGASKLAVWGMVATLSRQSSAETGIHPDHIRMMGETVERMLVKAWRRGEIGRTLLRVSKE